MLNVSRLMKGSIAALAIVSGGATAMTVVGNASTQGALSGERAPYAAAAPELTNDVTQSTANRFRVEFGAPSVNTAGVRGDRLPATRTQTARHTKRRLIDGDYPFAAIGWQRSLAAAASSVSKLDAKDEGALSRGCAACETPADHPRQTIAAARPAARG